MDLKRYDIITAEIKYEHGSVQTKKRPYVIVSNAIGTRHSNIITVMPLTSKIKKTDMPVHGCLEADGENGLNLFSMVLGEQPFTISKEEVIGKIGSVTSQDERNMINKVCFNSYFYGEKINWEEVLA